MLKRLDRLENVWRHRPPQTAHRAKARTRDEHYCAASPEKSRQRIIGVCATDRRCRLPLYHIEATVENRTGATITLLEVDYPTASFGADTLAVDQAFHHRIQTRDSGPISVQYTAGHGRQVLVTGPTLYEKQEGSIEIVLLPNGKAEFHPALSPQN